jgi:hypothetical protein
MKKKLIVKINTILILSLLHLSCNKKLTNGDWQGNENIAGITFDLSFKINNDKTYYLKGNSGGILIDEKGTYKTNSESEIILTSGEFKNWKLRMNKSSVELFTENDQYFMTLN